MSVLRDPKGNELKLVLLQIVDADDKGPITLKNRLDEEKISLADKAKNRFLMVWTPVDNEVGITTLDPLITAAAEAKEGAEQARVEIAQVRQDIAAVTAENKRLQAENEQKTTVLRELQKERDPSRVQRMIEEAVNEQTEILEDQIKGLHKQIAEKESEITGLRASKRKLKEANDRLKEKHGG